MARYKDVIVIAGGHSLASYDVADLRPHGYVIAVNDAMLHARCHEGLTMDRLWIEHRYHEAAARGMPVWVRKGVCRAHPVMPWMFEFACQTSVVDLTEEPGRLNGANSGECAIALAYQILQRREGEVRDYQPRLFLLGFDMCRGPQGEAYWYPPYPWATQGATKPGKYREWAGRFRRIATQLERAPRPVLTYNVTHRSEIDVFPFVAFNEFLEMTR